jgi:hypothetical protein
VPVLLLEHDQLTAIKTMNLSAFGRDCLPLMQQPILVSGFGPAMDTLSTHITEFSKTVKNDFISAGKTGRPFDAMQDSCLEASKTFLESSFFKDKLVRECLWVGPCLPSVLADNNSLRGLMESGLWASTPHYEATATEKNRLGCLRVQKSGSRVFAAVPITEATQYCRSKGGGPSQASASGSSSQSLASQSSVSLLDVRKWFRNLTKDLSSHRKSFGGPLTTEKRSAAKSQNISEQN